MANHGLTWCLNTTPLMMITAVLPPGCFFFYYFFFNKVVCRGCLHCFAVDSFCTMMFFVRVEDKSVPQSAEGGGPRLWGARVGALLRPGLGSSRILMFRTSVTCRHTPHCFTYLINVLIIRLRDLSNRFSVFKQCSIPVNVVIPLKLALLSRLYIADGTVCWETFSPSPVLLRSTLPW